MYHAAMKLRLFCMLAVCLLLTGCGLMDPQQQATALQVVDQMLMQGTITAEQAEALRQTILSGGQLPWWQQVGQVLLGAGLGYLGIQVAPARAATVAARKAAQLAKQ